MNLTICIFSIPLYLTIKRSSKIHCWSTKHSGYYAWIPVKLILNLDIKNNKIFPLIVGINYQDNYSFGTNFIYEKDIKKTLEVRARPNSEIYIDFWYNENYNSGNPIKHLKSVKYTTDLKEITELNFEVDSSKF